MACGRWKQTHWDDHFFKLENVSQTTVLATDTESSVIAQIDLIEIYRSTCFFSNAHGGLFYRWNQVREKKKKNGSFTSLHTHSVAHIREHVSKSTTYSDSACTCPNVWNGGVPRLYYFACEMLTTYGEKNNTGTFDGSRSPPFWIHDCTSIWKKERKK